jgi:hypothetical protein
VVEVEFPDHTSIGKAGTPSVKTLTKLALLLAISLASFGSAFFFAQQPRTSANAAPHRPQGPCDLYAAAGDPCVAAHSTTRALYASYNGPLYRVVRQSDGKALDIGVVQPAASPSSDAGGYANAASQDRFCANTYCWIVTLYDQSPKHNDLTQPPRGAFSGPAVGGFDNLPIADMAPVSIMGHKVYGVFIEPGMGLRLNDAKGTAVDDQAQGQYWVVNGLHFNNDCCFDYGNAEIDSRDDDNGTMETTYYGNSTGWYHGSAPGPWTMTDQENNLVGCANADGSKLCRNLPSIAWRFVTAMAKGEPHHWTSMGGDAQRGTLSVMFDGPRINSSYDPMRKQGAILLGNGGDNSNGSQGTFYEGAMTASGTFPTNDTDQQVQANVVAARYAVQPLSLAPASASATPPGLQTFTPGSSQLTTVIFTNTADAPATGLKLGISPPSKQWTSFIEGTHDPSKTFANPIAPGESVSATFHLTSGPLASNGDLVAHASWTDTSDGAKHNQTAAEKVRNVSPVKINEFSSAVTQPFIELYNAGPTPVDLANWTVTQHPAQQPSFSSVKIPPGTRLASHAFYLLALSNSGLAVPARSGDTTIHVRSTAGISVGDTIAIDLGSKVETRKVATVGTAASNSTTLWQPVPDGLITIPAGSTKVPVTSVSGFTVGEKIALGHGAIYPAVGLGMEQYEVATVTAVGKPGTQAFLAVDAPAGASTIQVTSVNNISVGDKIRLDIDSVGHGIETATVLRVGTQANRTNLSADAPAGATNIRVRRTNGFANGDKLIVGTPANHETVRITEIDRAAPNGASLTFTPALSRSHGNEEGVVGEGTGLDLAAPLKFTHAANLPFSDRGTGVTFQPATAFAHLSNEAVQALGTGIALDKPLLNGHEINAVVRDAAVTSAGYQGIPAPNQWFGGPALSPAAGNIMLRDSTGLVVDSLNYGLLVDPWAAEGYQATSGTGQVGCRVNTPGLAAATNKSAGRFPDGADTDSNCADFISQATAILAAVASAGATNIKVSSVAGFDPGQTISIDTGANFETAVIASVGTPGATTVNTATAVGATTIPLANPIGFRPGQTITIGSDATLETAVVVSGGRRGATAITVSDPLKFAHAPGSQVSGTGITLAAALIRPHASGAQVADSLPTPGAPNRYTRKP